MDSNIETYLKHAAWVGPAILLLTIFLHKFRLFILQRKAAKAAQPELAAPPTPNSPISLAVRMELATVAATAEANRATIVAGKSPTITDDQAVLSWIGLVLLRRAISRPE